MVSNRRRKIGKRINFRSLAHAPTNEQGVVYLFGMVHDKLDFTIESVQTGFPDCIARREMGDGRAERFRIEFEFESISFHRHRHDPDGADVIVCWKHNWPKCPDHLEVIELAEIIGYWANGEPASLSEYQRFCQRKRLDGFSFTQIAKLWHRRNDPKSIQPKPRLSKWQRFCQVKRREGVELAEIAKLWRKQKVAEGG
jgi:hypothetical protein